MKIAVLGAGAIGGLVAGYLKLKGEDVALVGHNPAVEAVRKNGLRISGARGDLEIQIDISRRLKEKPDLLILAVKTQDIGQALKDNSGFLKDALVLTTENGIRADDITAEYVTKENILSSIVLFGATSLEPGKIIHNFEGSWVIGSLFGASGSRAVELSRVLEKAFPAAVAEDLRGMKYLKIFVNANNCIPAILGLSMQEAFSDIAISSISMRIWKEGLEVVNKSGIKLVSLPDFPLERMIKLAEMPLAGSAGIFSGIMKGLSKKPVYGSILQSIKRGKPSEIDYINGEFVALAEEGGLRAPLNRKLVEMVHQVEASGRFFSRKELIEAVRSA